MKLKIFALRVFFLIAFVVLKGPYLRAEVPMVLNIDVQTGIPQPVSNKPIKEVVYQDNGIEVTYKFDSVTIIPDGSKNEVRVHIDGFEQCRESGFPSLPQRGDLFSVNQDESVELELLDCEYTDYHNKISPSIPIFLETESITSIRNKSIMDYSGFYPLSPVELNGERIFNGYKVYSVLISPVIYNDEDQIIRVFKTLKYKLSVRSEASANLCSTTNDLSNNAVTESQSSPGDNLSLFGIIPLVSPKAEKIEFVEDNISDTQATEINLNDLIVKPSLYVILTSSQFVYAAMQLKVWKTTIGYDCQIFHEKNWTKETVAAKIREIYNTAHFEGTYSDIYCLILGNNEYVPTSTDSMTLSSGVKEYETDVPYFDLLGFDHIPEIKHGRCPCSSLAEAQSIVTKIIKYEQDPITESSFYDNILIESVFEDHLDHSSAFVLDADQRADGYEDRRFCQTAQEVYDYLTDYNAKSITRSYLYDPVEVIFNNEPEDKEFLPTNWSRIFGKGDPIPAEMTPANNPYIWDFVSASTPKEPSIFKMH